jgi:hypothetical protein
MNAVKGVKGVKGPTAGRDPASSLVAGGPDSDSYLPGRVRRSPFIPFTPFRGRG